MLHPLPLPRCQIQAVVVEGGSSGDSLASETHGGCAGPHLRCSEEEDQHCPDPPTDVAAAGADMTMVGSIGPGGGLDWAC